MWGWGFWLYVDVDHKCAKKLTLKFIKLDIKKNLTLQTILIIFLIENELYGNGFEMYLWWKKDNKSLKCLLVILRHGISIVIIKPYMIYKGNIKYSQLSFLINMGYILVKAFYS